MDEPQAARISSTRPIRASVLRAGLLCAGLACSWASRADGDPLRNPFHDPFLQVTNGMAGCPVPEEPLYTKEEFNQAAHERAQRGVSCWLAGRCRLSNSYLYDAEIVPRVKTAISAASKYGGTSIWALGQRRRVWLKGCVESAEQSGEIEALIRQIDDVEGVQNELMVGSRAVAPYAVRKP
jgi:hypothetical protein